MEAKPRCRATPAGLREMDASRPAASKDQDATSRAGANADAPSPNSTARVQFNTQDFLAGISHAAGVAGLSGLGALSPGGSSRAAADTSSSGDDSDVDAQRVKTLKHKPPNRQLSRYSCSPV